MVALILTVRALLKKDNAKKYIPKLLKSKFVRVKKCWLKVKNFVKLNDNVPSKPVVGITTDIRNQYFLIEEQYSRSVANAGGIPILIPSISENEGLLKEMVTRIQGLLLPGSRDMDPKHYNEEPHPELRPIEHQRTESEIKILDEALNRNMPILGICGGMQLINVFLGGSLYQDIGSQIPDALCHERGSIHDIFVEDHTNLRKIIGNRNFSSKSYHHQSVKALGDGLRVCAKSQDDVIEGIEFHNSFILGVQWHPEREENETSNRIFKAFIEECKK